MAKVRILDDTVVNQIAAGEVVERPSSVVKELVENAIDAGASDVKVVLANGGRSGIEVIDNGAGMAKEDALLAIERFGTSKIRETEDLTHIATLGFRGEALPSIASVSRFGLHSREAEDQSGFGVAIRIEGGKLRNVEEQSLPTGTKVEVKNLFFNVPARKKFLRAENTETGQVKAIVADFAIAYPAIRFSLVVDGREVQSYPAAADFAARIKQLKIAGSKPIIGEESLELEGASASFLYALCQPVECVSSSARLRLLVNGRSVRDSLLLKAVRDGYGTFLRPGKYPTGVIALTLPSEEIDVNVHPQKTEVRFRSPSGVFRALSLVVNRAIEGVSLSPEQSKGSYSPRTWDLASTEVASQTAREQGAGLRELRRYPYPDTRPAEQPEFGFVPVDISSESPNGAPTAERVTADTVGIQALSSMRYVGQVFELYLLLEGAQRFAMLDMHAAHERVTFFRIKQQFLQGQVAAQTMLIPETIILAPDRIESVRRGISALAKLGVECDVFGNDALVVRSLPAALGAVSAKALFDDLMAMPEWADWEQVLDKRLDEVLSRIACHGSVRSGRVLKEQEVYALLSALEEVEAAAFCPHGRPIVKFFSESDLEQMFGRA